MNPTNYRRAAAVLVASVSMALAVSMRAPAQDAKPASPPPARKVRVQLNWVPEPEFGGIFAAKQDGVFKAEGLDVEIIAGAAGTPVPQMTASGQVEFGVVSGDQILSLRERGGNLVALFAVFHTSPMGVMVPEASPYRTLEALWKSDATVAMEAGLPFVRYLNRKFPGGKVRMVPTGSGLAAFERGTVQAQQCFVTAEPVQLELRKVPVRVFSLAEGGYDPYTVTIAASESFLQKDRAACAAFVRALREGWKRYLKEPSKYNPAIAKLNPAMSPEAMELAAKKQHDLVAPKGSDEVGWMERERWSTLAAQMKELGMVKDVPAVIDGVFWNVPR